MYGELGGACASHYPRQSPASLRVALKLRSLQLPPLRLCRIDISPPFLSVMIAMMMIILHQRETRARRGDSEYGRTALALRETMGFTGTGLLFEKTQPHPILKIPRCDTNGVGEVK